MTSLTPPCYRHLATSPHHLSWEIETCSIPSHKGSLANTGWYLFRGTHSRHLLAVGMLCFHVSYCLISSPPTNMAAWISDCEEIVDEKTDFLLCVTIRKWHLYVRWTLWYAADERTRNLRLVLLWFCSVQVIISIGWCFSRHEFQGKISRKFFFSATALPLL